MTGAMLADLRRQSAQEVGRLSGAHNRQPQRLSMDTIRMRRRRRLVNQSMRRQVGFYAIVGIHAEP